LVAFDDRVEHRIDVAVAKFVDGPLAQVRVEVEPDVGFIRSACPGFDLLAPLQPAGQVLGDVRQVARGHVQVEQLPDRVGFRDRLAGLHHVGDDVAEADLRFHVGRVADGERGADGVEDLLGVGLRVVGAVA